MRLFRLALGLLTLAGCGGSEPGGRTDGSGPSAPSGRGGGGGGESLHAAAAPDAAKPNAAKPDGKMIELQALGCTACHALPEALQRHVHRPRAPSLRALAVHLDPDQADAFLRGHYAGDDAAVVHGYLRSLAGPAAPRPFVEVPGGSIERGEQLVSELACAACHEPTDLDLGADREFEPLRRFLCEPASSAGGGVGVAHVQLGDAEARAVAAYLVRSQRPDGAMPVVRGFAYSYYEMKIENGDEPDLAARAPTQRGVADRIGIEKAQRKQQYALEFTAALDVPSAGDWTFATNSDDGSWLYIDGKLVVANGGLKPARSRSGRVRLDRGAHQLRVVYTQGGGGAVLSASWQAPGSESKQELPAESATASVVRLLPPPVRAPAAPLAAADLVAGRQAARARRCDVCHAVDDEAFAALAAPPAAPRWREAAAAAADRAAAGTAACPVRDARNKVPAGFDALPAPSAAPLALDDPTRLALAMQHDGCLSCHARDGEGGLSESARAGLVEVEDLGEEGLLPPDLSQVGRRLRGPWLQRVVAEGHAVRDYVRVRMPAYGEARGALYAELFAAIDAPDAPGTVDNEVEFSAEKAQLGQHLAGTGGRNCVSCHRMAGRDSLGAQGMDLSIQHERLRPAWLRDWLLKPNTLRPGTRMPSLWPFATEQDGAEVDAIRAWLSLGDAAPLPKGLRRDEDSLVLDPIDRPILHGAFLRGVSARTLAVGTPERTHYAFDLSKPRLAWLWRGAFLDATGTWVGRAGKLVEPLGSDRCVVNDFACFAPRGDAEAPRGDAEAPGLTRVLVGQRRTADGYPVLRVQAGDARYEDEVRARLAQGGSVLVRTLRCMEGALTLRFPQVEGYTARVAGRSAGEHTLAVGETLEIVYQW
ncbi:MAG: PA14 domain-containing protein [Planctomycetota bacterium]